jgi:hypothetical protein
LVEQHSAYIGPSRAESATTGCFARRLFEIATLMLQLRFRSYTEWFDTAKNQTDVWVFFERLFGSCIMSYWHNIVVVEEM